MCFPDNHLISSHSASKNRNHLVPLWFPPTALLPSSAWFQRGHRFDISQPISISYIKIDLSPISLIGFFPLDSILCTCLWQCSDTLIQRIKSRYYCWRTSTQQQWKPSLAKTSKWNWLKGLSQKKNWSSRFKMSTHWESGTLLPFTHHSIHSIYHVDWLVVSLHIYIYIRSKTKVTDSVLAEAKRLLCIGCFCIGTDQVDLQAAEKRGVRN